MKRKKHNYPSLPIILLGISAGIIIHVLFGFDLIGMIILGILPGVGLLVIRLYNNSKGSNADIN